MISRHSSRKFFLQNLKRWAGVMVFAVYLTIFYAVDFAMAQRGIVLTVGDERLGPGNGIAYYLTVIMALLCAFWGFGFLFSEKKTDFYLGLPVKRGVLFWSDYVSGILTGMAPCVIGRIVCFAIEENQDAHTLWLLFAGIAVNILGFLFFYHGTLVLIFLSGKFLPAVLGLAAVWKYGDVLIRFTAEKYSSVFFRTFYHSDLFDTLGIYLSPVKLYRQLAGIDTYSDTEVWSFDEKAPYFWGILVLVLLLGLAARVLFEKRPAEGAGKVLVFGKSKAVVKILLAVPAALLCGFYLMKCSVSGKSILLMILGIAGAAVLFNGTLEALYVADIRRFFVGKAHAVIIGAVSLLIAGSFFLDIFQYDRFVPDDKETESVAVSVKGIGDSAYWYEDRESFDSAKEVLDTMRLRGEEKQAALEWIRQAADETVGEKEAVSCVAVLFRGKNGKDVYRKYDIDSERLEAFAELYECEAYREGSTPLAACRKTGRKEFVWTNGPETWRLDLNDEENVRLLKTYQEELAAQSFQDLKDMAPCGVLTLSDEAGESGASGRIYPSFTETIEFIKRQGVVASRTIQDYEITKAEVIWQNADKKTGKENVVLTDRQTIEQLRPYLIYEGCAVNPAVYPMEACKVIVRFKNEGSNTFGIVNCRLKAGIYEETEAQQ